MGLRKLVGISLLVMGIPFYAQAVEYYRYIDDNGITVISRQGVPPNYIGNGYDVLNERGRVIRTIPRAPTAQERQQMQEAKQQAQYDRHLLRLYSTPEDVERARDRKLVEIDGLIALVRGNLHSVTSNKAQLLSKAANMERSGKKVPEDILLEIDKHEKTETKYLRDIEQYVLQKADIERGFAQDKQRIMQLLGKK